MRVLQGEKNQMRWPYSVPTVSGISGPVVCSELSKVATAGSTEEPQARDCLQSMQKVQATVRRRASNTCDKSQKACTWGGPVEVPVRDSLADSTAQNTRHLTSENEDSDDELEHIGSELIHWATSNKVPGSGLSGSQESSLISGIRKQKPRTKVISRCPPCKRGHLVCDDGMPCNPCVARCLQEYCSGDKELPKLKRGRPSRACDRCRLKWQCDGGRPCHRCQAAGAECTWTAADSTRIEEEDDVPYEERLDVG
jgi:hypothetical protein